MKKSILFIFFIFLYSSCIKYIDIEPPSYNSEIFLIGILNENEPAKIFVNKTLPLNETNLSESIPDAEVILLHNRTILDTLAYDPFTKLYQSDSISTIEGEYKIEVHYRGETASAYTSFPSSPNIEIMEVTTKKIPLDNEIIEATEIRLKIHDPPGKNYYQLQTYYGATPDWIYLDLVPTDMNDPVILNEGLYMHSDIIFSDIIFDGQDYEMVLYFNDFSHFSQLRILMVVSSLTEYAYRWIKYINTANYYNFFENVEPAFVPDNVDGGLGILGARKNDSIYYTY